MHRTTLHWPCDEMRMRKLELRPLTPLGLCGCTAPPRGDIVTERRKWSLTVEHFINDYSRRITIRLFRREATLGTGWSKARGSGLIYRLV